MTRLREALRSRNKQLLRQVESLVDRATPQLWHTWSTFQTGTKHTPEHTQSVEAIASLLLPNDVIAAMNEDEIALLILACHFHDLGMVGTEADNATKEGRDRVRKEHAISIGDRIREKWQDLGFENQTYAEILAEVCRGHRPEKVDGIANWKYLPLHRNVAPDRFVRVRLVSAMIYAADELHIGDDRAPKREEEWKEIRTAESLRHWRRHQALTGPTRPNDSICFDVRIDTLSFEEDIRQILKKALLAVADLRRGLLEARIAAKPPEVEIQWLRDSLWKLMIAKVCRDRSPRNRDRIREQVLDEFKIHRLKFEDFSDLCLEQPADDAGLIIQIDRAISDFVTRDLLVPGTDPATLRLASDSRSAQCLLDLTGKADKTERLFARAIDASHEQSFYESETGKRFIRDYIFPEIKASYAVDIATMPGTAPLRTVIESSPTACRLLRQISTPPGTLVKYDLLQIATTAGLCFDLMNNPELFLDKSLRTAIREVFAGTVERLPRFMNFIQELAIIKDLSFDQVMEIVIPSESERAELKGIDHDSLSINISQEFPRERPEWALPYLLLAGRRTEEPFTILNSPQAPFRLSVDPSDSALFRLNQEQPVTISITPTAGAISSVVSLRASVSYDASRRLLVLMCQKLHRTLQNELPIIVELPSTKPDGRSQITFSFVETALQVGQLLDLQRASESTSDGDLEVQDHIDGVGVLGTMQYSEADPFRFPVIFPVRDLVALADVDRNLPIPCVAAQELLERIAQASPENLPVEFEAVKVAVSARKPPVTSIALRFATANGQDYLEEFLGCLPLGVNFSAPKVEGGPIPQDELNRIWVSGEEHWTITTFFREDSRELARQIKDWVRDPSQPFPFRFENNPQFHYCKTRMELEHFKHIDRFWYVEKPVIFRFCPATKAEQYRVEREYWRSKGDERRVELLEELIAQAEKDAERSAPDVGGPAIAETAEPTETSVEPDANGDAETNH
jgi:hypothetical protein